jgi:hypothetical protein
VYIFNMKQLLFTLFCLFSLQMTWAQSDSAQVDSTQNAPTTEPRNYGSVLFWQAPSYSWQAPWNLTPQTFYAQNLPPEWGISYLRETDGKISRHTRSWQRIPSDSIHRILQKLPAHYSHEQKKQALQDSIKPGIEIEIHPTPIEKNFSRAAWWAFFRGRYINRIEAIAEARDSSGILLRDTLIIADTSFTGYCGIFVCKEPVPQAQERSLIRKRMIPALLNETALFLDSLANIPDPNAISNTLPGNDSTATAE